MDSTLDSFIFVGDRIKFCCRQVGMTLDTLAVRCLNRGIYMTPTRLEAVVRGEQELTDREIGAIASVLNIERGLLKRSEEPVSAEAGALLSGSGAQRAALAV